MNEKTEFDLQRDVVKGERARQLINDPMIQDALHNMRDDVIACIETSKFRDTDEREECYRMLRAISAFERQFKRFIDDGKVAQSKLQALRNKVRGVFS